MKKKVFWLFGIISLLCTLVSCSSSNSGTTISFDSNEYYLEIGTTLQLEPIVKNGSLGTTKLSWKSENEEIVKCDEGLINAVSEGKTIVTVTSLVDPTIWTCINIIVTPPYEIRYNLNGGVNSEINPDKYLNANCPIVLANPIKEGYRFIGWYEGENKVTQIEKDTKRLVNLEAKWEIINYTITYELDGGINNELNPTMYNVETPVVVFQNPTKEGAEFLGWYTDDNFTEGSEITEITYDLKEDITLYAKWNLYEYNLSIDEHANVDLDLSIKYYNEYDSIGRQLTLSTRKNSISDWWHFIALKKTNIENVFEVVQCVYLKPNVTADFDYVISFHGDYRLTNEETLNTYNKLISFVYSSNNLGVLLKIDNIPTEGRSYEADIKVTKYVPTTTYTVDDLDTALYTPAFEGYNFLGWKTVNEFGVESEEYITSLKELPLGDLSVVAKWELINYNITYELDGGVNNEENPATFNDLTIYTFKNPKKEGYKFMGWYLEPEYKTKVEEVMRLDLVDVTLYAKWELA